MNAQRCAIVDEARAWIGTPYVHQASLKGAGCDCLGLVRGVWRAVAGDEPDAVGPYTADWAEAGGVERLRDMGRRYFVERGDHAFEAGDVLLFRWRDHLPAKHAAIAASPASMVHAHDGASVCEVALTPWWLRRLAYVFSFPAAPER